MNIKIYSMSKYICIGAELSKKDAIVFYLSHTIYLELQLASHNPSPPKNPENFYYPLFEVL